MLLLVLQIKKTHPMILMPAIRASTTQITTSTRVVTRSDSPFNGEKVVGFDSVVIGMSCVSGPLTWVDVVGWVVGMSCVS